MDEMNWTVGTRIEYCIKSQTKQQQQHQQFDQANKCGKCMSYNVRTTRERPGDGESSLFDWMAVVSFKPTMVLSMLMTTIYIYFLRSVVAECVWFAHHWPHSVHPHCVWLFNFICGFVCAAINCYTHTHSLTHKICKWSLSKDA